MFSQNKNRLPRDESVVTKWDQLKQYENEVDRVSQNGQSLSHQDNRQYEQPANSLGVMKTFKQLKTSGAKTFSNIRSQVTDMYRRKKERNQGYVSSGGGGAVTVSQNPNAETESGSGQRLGALGAKIRNSRSLQSLEVATMDGVRQMVDTATNMGGSMVSRYIMGGYYILCISVCL